MGCGCGGQTAPAIPVTSGDFATEATPGMPRFKVETDAVNGDEASTVMFETYRAARLYQAEHGGKLRMA